MYTPVINILLIEDNPGDVELTRVGLAESRIVNDLKVIVDGELAINFFERGKDMPDIVLLDINLPKVDGLEILKKIRSMDSSKNLPVVMLTSSEAESDIKQSFSDKANYFLSKPIDFDRFHQILKSLEIFHFDV